MKKIFALIFLTTTYLMSNITYAADFDSTIITAVEAGETNINISSFGLNPTEALEKVLELINTAPELWAVNEKVNLKGSSKKAEQVIISYDYSEKDRAKIQTEIDKVTDIAISKVDKTASVYEQAKTVYKYLLDNYNYDFSLTKHKEYELYSTGEGVCKAYSLAFKDIMQKLNIPCKVVVSKEMQHQWNVIQINGHWYNVDASYGDMYRTGNDDYSAFCKSDFFMQLLGFYGGHIEGNSYCTDRGYDYAI